MTTCDSGYELPDIWGNRPRRDALLALEKCMEGRQEYKKEIKTPVELNMRQRIRMIANQV